MDNWETTSQLRFAVPPETTTKAPVLQQLWVKRFDATLVNMEWRDVPTEVVEKPRACIKKED